MGRRCILAAILLIGCLQAAQAEPDPASGDEWQINFVPYYWAPEMSLRLRWNDQESRLDLQPEQQDLITNPNVFAAAFGAWRRGRGVLLEGESLDSEFDLPFPDGQPGLLMLDSQRLGVGGAAVWKQPLVGDSELTVAPWLGIRYRRVSIDHFERGTPDSESLGDSGTDPSLILRQSEESDWLEPFAGFRARWSVSPKWSLSLGGSVDGLLQDNLTWNAASWLRFQVSKEFNIAIGYRYQEYKFSGGGWELEGRAQGFAVGLEVDFLAQPSSPAEPWYAIDFAESLTVPPDRPHQPEAPSDAPAEDPAEPGRLAGALDRGHDLLNNVLDAGVEFVDTALIPEDQPQVPREKSRFKLEVYSRITDQTAGGVDQELKLGGQVSLDLPNLTRGLTLRVSDQAVDSVPGSDPFDREEGLNIGLEKTGLFWKQTKAQVGLRSSLDAYASASWVPELRLRRWRLVPETRVYYRTDKGAGAIGSMLAAYRLQDRYRASHRASVEYSEETDGDLEWLGNLAFAYLFEGDMSDYHRALFTEFSARGSFEFGPIRYQWSPFRYRAPLYKKWLYGEIGPEIQWRDEDLWDPELSLRLAVSSLFWGTPER